MKLVEERGSLVGAMICDEADELFAVAFEVALGERRYEHGCEQHECD